MKKTTRRILLWIGVALILLPTAIVIFTLLQPREYQSDVFVEVRQAGHPPPPEPLVDRDTLFVFFFFVGIYLPGILVLATVFLSRRRELRLHGTQTI
jgi:hypothetical protein